MTDYIVLVCGGRAYNTGLAHRHVFTTLNTLHAARPINLIVHGGAAGADTLANLWALTHHVRAKPYWADWQGQGKAAGFIRNQKMLDMEKPDLVVAFPGGTGTADMVRRSVKAGVAVLHPDPLPAS